MALIYCRSCGIANDESQARCHCCSAVFAKHDLKGRAPEVRIDDPTSIAAHLALRKREGIIASHALQAAAWLLVVRGSLIPFLLGWIESIRKVPLTAQDSPFGNVDRWSFMLISYSAATVFFGLCLWARRNPLPAAIAALLIYAGISMPELLDGQGFLGKGIIGKVVMCSILARAIAAGMVHASTPDLNKLSPAPAI